MSEKRRPVKLISLRESKGLTQIQVAEGAGISRSMYAMIEAGERFGTYRTLKKIADFFETSVEELFDEYFFGQTAHETRHDNREVI